MAPSDSPRPEETALAVGEQRLADAMEAVGVIDAGPAEHGFADVSAHIAGRHEGRYVLVDVIATSIPEGEAVVLSVQMVKGVRVEAIRLPWAEAVRFSCDARRYQVTSLQPNQELSTASAAKASAFASLLIREVC
jgi:hypothetical protein